MYKLNAAHGFDVAFAEKVYDIGHDDLVKPGTWKPPTIDYTVWDEERIWGQIKDIPAGALVNPNVEGGPYPQVKLDKFLYSEHPQTSITRKIEIIEIIRGMRSDLQLTMYDHPGRPKDFLKNWEAICRKEYRHRQLAEHLDVISISSYPEPDYIERQQDRIALFRLFYPDLPIFSWVWVKDDDPATFGGRLKALKAMGVDGIVLWGKRRETSLSWGHWYQFWRV